MGRLICYIIKTFYKIIDMFKKEEKVGDLSENFSRSEHACSCGCGFDTVDVLLNRVLQCLRDHFKRKVTITGGNRCKKKNKATKGASSTSLHMEGKAVDFVVKGVAPLEVYAYLETEYPDRYGIGLYDDRVHLDVRRDRARWDKRKKARP